MADNNPEAPAQPAGPVGSVVTQAPPEPPAKSGGRCQRPAWTFCFFFIWILVVPGALLTHISVGLLIPHIEDLPANIVKGFDEVFKFKYLEQDSKEVTAQSSAAIAQCKLAGKSLKADKICPNQAYKSDLTKIVAAKEKMNTATAKEKIQKAFDTSLSVVQLIANDKYFGTKELNTTAEHLNKMKKEFEKVPATTMKCEEGVPTFCEIYTSGDGIVTGMDEVNKALDMFKTSDAVKRFDENTALLNVLHGLPYFMVIALAFFSFFWLRGGVCCCCEHGTKTGFGLIFFALFWLASFIIYAVVLVTGIAMKYLSHNIEVPVLKGKPTLEEAIDHIQTRYPKFWAVVFADLEEGLDLLWRSSVVFTIIALLIFLYSCCECCCRPYGGKYAKKADA